MGMDRLTLLDISRQTDPDGKPAQVCELLTQTNPIYEDAPAYPSNAPTGNRVTLRSSLPRVGFSKINQGVIRTKSSTEQRVDTIGLIAGLSEVDSKLKRIVGDAAFNKARWNEDQGFLEATSQLIALNLLYGDELADESAFTGLATRMRALATSITGSQVWSYGSVTGSDGSSLYVVDWGERGAHLIYPPNSTAGVDVRDKGELRVTDVDGNPMMAYVTAYDISVGLSVKDPRHIARLANIDTSEAQGDTAFKLAVGTATTGGLIDLLTAMPNPNGMQRVIYCAQRLYAAFMKQAINKSNANITVREYLGKLTPHFWEVPIRRVDQISIAEATVS